MHCLHAAAAAAASDCCDIGLCERLFSKLKLIKNYLRSTVSAERATDRTAMLSIENERSKTLIFQNWWMFLPKKRVTKTNILGLLGGNYRRHFYH